MNNHLSRRDWLKVSGITAGTLTIQALSSHSAEPSMDKSRALSSASGSSVVFQKTIPVRHEVDVFIAGGGPAGLASAIAARSQGVSVYLAEAHSCFGGMGTAARVPAFMQFTSGKIFLAGGVGKEVRDRMASQAPFKAGGNIDTETLKRIYDDMMSESKAGFTFHTSLIAVEASNGHVSHVICSAPSGLFAVRAKMYIDATGNGDLSAWAGASFEKGDEQGNLMPGTLCSTWSNIDWDTWIASRPKIPQPDGYMLEKAFADGVFTVRDEHLTGMHRFGEHLGGGNIGHTFGVDGTDEVSLTKALVWARKSLKEYEKYYRKYLKGFEKTHLVATGSLLGVRETRRITGDYVLSLDDYKKRATFEDEIGRYCYSIDLHPTRPGKDTYEQHRKEFDEEFRYKSGESYGIPYRILTPRGLNNVLVAGRCVSSDRYVHGSIRVMPGCFITGQAAGIAAAIAAQKSLSTHKMDMKELQGRLKSFGAYLPNA